MQTKLWLCRGLALLIVLPLTGCGLHKESFTYKLWHTEEFRHLREPATNALVAVHYSPSRKDFLVTYNSLRDGDNTPRQQSYFLGDYETSDLDHRKPQPVSTNKMQLVPVPVNGPTNVLPHATFDWRLTIYTAQGQIGPYRLPTYPESDGTVLKAALTPFTATGDAACLSLIAGFIAGLVYVGGGASFNGY